MTQFEETTVRTVTLACPECDGDKVVKVGMQVGQQCYMCKYLYASPTPPAAPPFPAPIPVYPVTPSRSACRTGTCG